MQNLIDGNSWTYILPLLIFVAKISDVTLGTLRIVMLARGEKVIAPILGFFEILIWLLAVTKVLQNLDNWVNYIAYAGGFAMGNYVGLVIERKLAVGVIKIQIITKKGAKKLIAALVQNGYGITSIDAEGAVGKVNVIYCILKRSTLPEMIALIKQYNPKAFYSVADVKAVSHSGGVFPLGNKAKKQFVFKR